MGGANPWHLLRARDDVVLTYGWLAECRGRTTWHGTHYVITLDARLDRVTRRCVLMHELVHIELGAGFFYERTTSRRLIGKCESIVDDTVARRLVPLDELEAYASARVDAGLQLDLVDVALEFDVTPDVARRAVMQLREHAAQRVS